MSARMPSMPRVGIALAAYKPDAEIFEQQLRSIAAQSYTNWFCVVTLDSPLSELADDAALAPYMADERFVWTGNGARLGHKGNFERAIALVAQRGADMIATCDQDDVWYDDKLAVLVDALREAGPLSLAHSDMHLLRDGSCDGPTLWTNGHRVVDNAGCWQSLVVNKVTGCTMMFDAELARRFPRIPASFDYHDQWFALVASCVGRVVAVHRVLGAYRQHGANVVGAEAFSWGVKPSALGRVSGEVRANRSRWELLNRRRTEAEREGVTISAEARRILFARDFGLSLALRGVQYFFSDPRLARYCLRVAIGKLVSLSRPGAVGS